MLKAVLSICLLAACGSSGLAQHSKLAVKSVSPELQEEYGSVIEELYALGRAGLIVYAPGSNGVEIIGDTAAIIEKNKTVFSGGYFDPNTNRIYLPLAEDKVPIKYGGSFSLSKLGLTLAMAHELGHAFGLEHTDHGLMTPDLNSQCLLTPGACLVAALKENGNIF